MKENEQALSQMSADYEKALNGTSVRVNKVANVRGKMRGGRKTQSQDLCGPGTPLIDSY